VDFGYFGDSMIVTGKSKLLGVIGYPIEHSLSPKMHNAALEYLALNYVYLPFLVSPENLKRAIEGFEAISLVGFSVTIPHKQTIIPLLNHVSPIAKAVRAVNTVAWSSQGWQGTNTDVAGFISPLLSLSKNWTDIKPLVLGSGGAARAVIVGLAEIGCRSVDVVGRQLEKLKFLQTSLNEAALDIEIHIHNWNQREHLITKTTLLINTTPLGMEPHTELSPIEEKFWNNIPPDLIAYDLIYTPSPTLFLQQAADHGAKTIDGKDMLIEQGAAAFNIWLGQDAPVEVMRKAMYG